MEYNKIANEIYDELKNKYKEMEMNHSYDNVCIINMMGMIYEKKIYYGEDERAKILNKCLIYNKIKKDIMEEGKREKGENNEIENRIYKYLRDIYTYT
jgi:hypothetical protein